MMGFFLFCVCINREPFARCEYTATQAHRQTIIAHSCIAHDRQARTPTRYSLYICLLKFFFLLFIVKIRLFLNYRCCRLDPRGVSVLRPTDRLYYYFAQHFCFFFVQMKLFEFETVRSGFSDVCSADTLWNELKIWINQKQHPRVGFGLFLIWPSPSYSSRYHIFLCVFFQTTKKLA